MDTYNVNMGCSAGAHKPATAPFGNRSQGKSDHARLIIREPKTQNFLFKRSKYAGWYDLSIQETGNILFWRSKVQRKKWLTFYLAGKKRLKILPARVLSRVPHELMSSSRVTHESFAVCSLPASCSDFPALLRSSKVISKVNKRSLELAGGKNPDAFRLLVDSSLGLCHWRYYYTCLYSYHKRIMFSFLRKKAFY